MRQEISPQVKIERLLLASDPTFEGGSTHTAIARLTNPTTAEFTYTTEVYLGVTKEASSGVGPVTILAGESANVVYTIVMPTLEGDYDVYLDVWVGTELIAHYKATEVITISISPAIEVGPITWE